MKQLSLIPKRKSEIEFGGGLLVGKRKGRRPFSRKAPIHLILKSLQAKGQFAFNPSNRKIEILIYKMAHRFQIKTMKITLNWSHIHLIIQVHDRKSYNRFIRALTGAMVLLLKAPKGFFELRPYTKIGTWGRQLKTWFDYSVKNELEAAGLIIKNKPLNKTSNLTLSRSSSC